MNNYTYKIILVNREVEAALSSEQPIVALESTLITHGMPYPQNLSIAANMEREVRSQGAIPATIAILSGEILVGLSQQNLEKLAKSKEVRKVSVRDIAPAVVEELSGGTTVAATMRIASLVGIRVFATGGIGGVHRAAIGDSVTYDVSADLIELSRTPVIVVCAGAKAILDIPATLEYLETFSVPVIGYKTDDFPSFYSKSSGHKLNAKAEVPDVVYRIAQLHWSLGLRSGVLVANPLADEDAIENTTIESAIEKALLDAHNAGISGQDVTPFLLKRVSEVTEGRSLSANLKLLLNNARLAAKIACAFDSGQSNIQNSTEKMFKGILSLLVW